MNPGPTDPAAEPDPDGDADFMPNADAPPGERADPADSSAPRRRSGRTSAVTSGSQPPGEAPDLPHERDESTAAPGADAPVDAVGRQAKADVDRGLVDTDRGAPMDRTYHRLHDGDAPATGKVAPD